MRQFCHCRYDLHVLLVEHCKRCPRCSKTGHARKEVHGHCPLGNLAAAAKAGHKLSAAGATEDAKEHLSPKDLPKGAKKGGGENLSLCDCCDHIANRWLLSATGVILL